MDAIFDRGYDCPNASWNGTLHLVLPGHHHRRRHRPRVGARLHAVHRTTSSTRGSPARSTSPTRTSGARRSTASTAAAPTRRAARAARARARPSRPRRRRSRSTRRRRSRATTSRSPRSFGPPLTRDRRHRRRRRGARSPPTPTGRARLDGCSAPSTNAAAVAGKIALVDRGTCGFAVKVQERAGRRRDRRHHREQRGDRPPRAWAGVGSRRSRSRRSACSRRRATRSAPARRERHGERHAAGAAGHGRRATAGSSARTSTGGFGGALRDMWNPTCYCEPGQGVRHRLLRLHARRRRRRAHATPASPTTRFALLVDGGTYNGQTIAPIGLTKAAHIYFRAADRLPGPRQRLRRPRRRARGVVRGPRSGSRWPRSPAVRPGQTITVGGLRPGGEGDRGGRAADAARRSATSRRCCASRRRAAVRHRHRAAPRRHPARLDFEVRARGWSVEPHGAASPTSPPRDWTWVTGAAERAAGSGVLRPRPGHRHLRARAATSRASCTWLTSPRSRCRRRPTSRGPPSSTGSRPRPGFDGGNLKVSVNGGPWQLVPPSEFTFNGYNAPLASTAARATRTRSPASRRGPAPTGAPSTAARGVARTSTSATSPDRATRSGCASDLGTDGCGGAVGWYLDNVNVFSCTPNVPSTHGRRHGVARARRRSHARVRHGERSAADDPAHRGRVRRRSTAPPRTATTSRSARPAPWSSRPAGRRGRSRSA